MPTWNWGNFSVDGWSIRWSCALVAGSGGVWACGEESRHLAMWVWICTQTSNEFITFSPNNWWFLARSDKTWHTSMACCTSGDFITQVFDIQWPGDSCCCSSTTSSEWRCWQFYFCVLWCVDTMWEWRKDWVIIRVQAALCMLVCMWLRVSFLQKKLDAPPSLDRCKILFLYRIKLSFMKC